MVPNSIELRQEGFLWANDLSTYDSVLSLPFEIPFYGDHVSLFTLLMNGKILERDGKVAALHRFSESGDARSNIHAGGSTKKAKITSTIREIAELVRPKLVQDGVFFAGLDIAGDKLLETNIFSPGGLGTASDLEGVDFGTEVMEAIERKVEYKRVYGTLVSNKFLNCL